MYPPSVARPTRPETVSARGDRTRIASVRTDESSCHGTHRSDARSRGLALDDDDARPALAVPRVAERR